MINIEYEKVGDYYLPKLIAPIQKHGELGKYAKLRLRYLKEYKKAFYIMLKMENKLIGHLEDVQALATWYVNSIVTELVEKEGITEELKATNQLEWVGRINNIKNRTEEVVIREIIFDGGAE